MWKLQASSFQVEALQKQSGKYRDEFCVRDLSLFISDNRTLRCPLLPHNTFLNVQQQVVPCHGLPLTKACCPGNEVSKDS